jgi:hypothetical protein
LSSYQGRLKGTAQGSFPNRSPKSALHNLLKLSRFCCMRHALAAEALKLERKLKAQG